MQNKSHAFNTNEGEEAKSQYSNWIPFLDKNLWDATDVLFTMNQVQAHFTYMMAISMPFALSEQWKKKRNTQQQMKIGWKFPVATGMNLLKLYFKQKYHRNTKCTEDKENVLTLHTTATKNSYRIIRSLEHDSPNFWNWIIICKENFM